MSKFDRTLGWIFLLFLTVLNQTALSQHTSYGEEYMERFRATAKQLKKSGCKEKLVPGYKCMRECKDGEQRRICYFYLVLEEYPAAGAACWGCMPNSTNQLTGYPHCECVAGDGVEKTAMVFNRMLPGPCIQVCRGDYLIIDVQNRIPGIEASTHWHGLHQKGYQYADGVPYLTQCPIGSGTTYRYQFSADNSGTHFYHSHVSVHMIDGQYGCFVIRDKGSMDPQYSLYDIDARDHVFVISDWMHTISLQRLPGSLLSDPGQSADNLLINGLGISPGTDATPLFRPNFSKFTVQPGKRYRFRLIFACSTVCPVEFTIEKHKFVIIATDGVPIEPVETDALTAVAAERYDIVVTASHKSGSFWIQVRARGECETRSVMQYAVLMYEGSSLSDLSSMPQYSDEPSDRRIVNSMNEEQCKSDKNQLCIEDLQSLNKADFDITSNADAVTVMEYGFADVNASVFNPGSLERFFVAFDQTHLYGMMQNISFEEPSAPPISQREGREQLCSARTLAQSSGPRHCTNSVAIRLGATVEIILVDTYPVPDLHHPFHLHGYNFYVICQSKIGQNGTKSDIRKAVDACRKQILEKGPNYKPVVKDTVMVRSGSVAILRFKADNPGWWFFHCHFEWHVATGMAVMFRVGDNSDLPSEPHGFPRCGNFLPAPDLKSCA